MKNIFIVIALFLFASMSTAIFAASQSDGSNKINNAKGASSKDDICWEGSNSGNQHDAVTNEDYEINEGKQTQMTCPSPTNISDKPPKHCTHTNKNGNKHKDSASGC
ncbi:MAG: hypothetical protein ACI9N9_000976 [Enterobacterales bacterium]|jgi:hypothetical protein